MEEMLNNMKNMKEETIVRALMVIIVVIIVALAVFYYRIFTLEEIFELSLEGIKKLSGIVIIKAINITLTLGFIKNIALIISTTSPQLI